MTLVNNWFIDVSVRKSNNDKHYLKKSKIDIHFLFTTTLFLTTWYCHFVVCHYSNSFVCMSAFCISYNNISFYSKWLSLTWFCILFNTTEIFNFWTTLNSSWRFGELQEIHLQLFSAKKSGNGLLENIQKQWFNPEKTIWNYTFKWIKNARILSKHMTYLDGSW